MQKVAIIGVGNVGSTVAFILFTHGTVGQIYLLDKNALKVEANERDLRDATVRDHYTVKVNGLDWNSESDWKKLKDVDVIVTAFGDISATARTGDRQAELKLNTLGARDIGNKIKKSGFNGIILNISNPCDIIVTELQKQTGLPKNRVFGTGTFLDTSRMKRFVAEELNVDPHNVHGYVLAEHGASQFTAWSTVYIGDKKASELFSKEKLDDLSSQPNRSSKRVSHGKGFTNWAIASTAARLIEDIFVDAHSIVPCSNYDKDFNVYASWPVVLGENGIERRIKLNLTDDEKKKYKESLKLLVERKQKAEKM